MEDAPQLRQLLDGGADVQDPDETGLTLLDHAVDVEGDGARQTGGPLHVDITALLLARGADPLAPDFHGHTSLDLANIHEHWLAVELFTAWAGNALD
jgi:ankyrin repeat protein